MKRTTFDLNRAIQQWRDDLAQSPTFRSENLHELEAHLRDSTTGLQSRGLSEEEAFLVAARRLGNPDLLGREFGKLNRSAVWETRVLWMLAGMLVFAMGSDLASVVSSALMFSGSGLMTNGFSLGWLGVAGKCAVLVLVLALFRFAALGRLGRFSLGISQLFQRPVLAFAIFLSAALALKLAANGFTAASAQRLPPITLGQAYAVTSFASVAGQFLILVLLLTYFARCYSRRRTTNGSRALLLSLLIPLVFQESSATSFGQTASPSTGNPNQAKKQDRVTLDEAMTLWRASKKDEAVAKFMAVDFSRRPLFPTGSVLNYTEAQFVALPQAARDKLATQMNADIRVLKEICAHVRDAAKSALAGGDSAKSGNYTAQLKKCGDALNQPDSLALLKLVGKAIQKQAAETPAAPQNWETGDLRC